MVTFQIQAVTVNETATGMGTSLEANITKNKLHKADLTDEISKNLV
jgi:hypothetical protein